MTDRLCVHKTGSNIRFAWKPIDTRDYSGIQIQLFGHMSQPLSDLIPLSSAYDISFNVSPEFGSKQYVMYITIRIGQGGAGNSIAKVSRKFPLKILNTDVPYFPRDLYMFIANESIRPV